MTWSRQIILAIIAVSFASAWLFRYDATAGDSGIVFVADRWTGNIYQCAAANCFQAFPPTEWIDLNSN